MKHGTVGSVMTADVVRATYGTPFKEVARLLAEHGVSGLPVLDDDEKVIGVISASDLLVRQAGRPGPTAPRRFRLRLPARGVRRRAARARARTAGQLMSAPPVTVHAEASVAEAARTMARHTVQRLPVVDEEHRLVGIVTRPDLLRVFLRPDREIRSEVIGEVLGRSPRPVARTVAVAVHDGVVTLEGRVERRSEAEIAVRLARRIDGVVDVVDHLAYRFDDARLPPAAGERTAHAVTGPVPRER